MINQEEIMQEDGSISNPKSWVYTLTFIIRKEIDGGQVKKKLKELDSSVEVLSCSESQLAQ